MDNPGPSDMFGWDEAGIHGPINTRSRLLHTHGESICYAFLQKGKCIYSDEYKISEQVKGQSLFNASNLESRPRKDNRGVHFLTAAENLLERQ